MILPSGPVRVYVATKPVDFRKGIDGLAALAQAELRLDPFSGVVLVRRGARTDGALAPHSGRSGPTASRSWSGTARAWC